MTKTKHVHHQRSSYHVLVFPNRDMIWLLPSLAIFFLCYAVPFSMSLLSTFMDISGAYAGCENYRLLICDPFYLLAIKNTLVFLFTAIAITLVLGALTAHVLFSFRFLRVSILLLLIPFFLPASSIAALWRAMMSNNFWIVQILRPKDASWKFISLLLLFIWKNAGAVTALLLVGMSEIDVSIFYAAQLDGASKRMLLYKIELPLLRHIILIAFLYLLMNGVRIFRECYLLYGGYPPSNLFFVQHYVNNYFVKLDYPLLSSAAVVFSSLVLVLYCLIWGILRKGDE